MNDTNQNHLLILSDTGMYQKDGAVYAFGPVVMELLVFLTVFDHVTWIGAQQNHNKTNASFIKIPSTGVKPILIEQAKGSGLRYKWNTLQKYPKMWKLLKKQIESHTCIHSRAPSHPAYIAMRLSKKYPNKQFWFKYAGSWVEPASIFYNYQRNTLKKLNANSVVTVNGLWENQPAHLLPFENPCLTQAHRNKGKIKVATKRLEKPIHYCFVGGLNENKGCEKIIDAWLKLKHPSLGKLFIVGSGALEAILKEKALKSTNEIIFCGNLPKEEVHLVYEQCHFIILPSKTEGFPKVIGEAMNYGCVPIVSNISCLSQYIKNGANGFLLAENNSNGVFNSIQESMLLKEDAYLEYITINYRISEKFTYDNYKKRMIEEVFNMNQ